MSIINETKQCCHDVDIKFLNGSYISFCKKCGKILDTYTEVIKTVNITGAGLQESSVVPVYVTNPLVKVNTEPQITITGKPTQILDNITGTFHKPEYVVTSTIGSGEKLTTATISNLYTTS